MVVVSRLYATLLFENVSPGVHKTLCDCLDSDRLCGIRLGKDIPCAAHRFGEGVNIDDNNDARRCKSHAFCIRHHQRVIKVCWRLSYFTTKYRHETDVMCMGSIKILWAMESVYLYELDGLKSQTILVF